MTNTANPVSTEFDAVVDANRAAALAAASGLAGDRVPLTFAAMWLFAEEVETLIARTLGPATVPIHVGQQFRYLRPLRIGERCRVKVDVAPLQSADRAMLALDMTVSDTAATTVLEGRATIALQSASAGADH